MSKILVLGGTGFVGRSVCEKLVERSGGGGGSLRVASRHPQRAGHIQMLPTVEVVRADVHDDATLDRLMAGRDAVINLVAILHGSQADFDRVNAGLPKRLADACKRHGVRRVIHVSALGADASAPSKYLRSKAAGEAALKDASLDLTILRPSVIFGLQDSFINLFAGLQKVFPVLPLAGADSKFQPVWVEDVAAAIVRALDMPESVGTTVECTGPTVHTLKQMVMMAGAWSGHARSVISLPDALGRLQAAIMEMLPGTPLMSRDNLDSMKLPCVASGSLPGLEFFGIRASSLETVMAPLLSGQTSAVRMDSWRALARRR